MAVFIFFFFLPVFLASAHLALSLAEEVLVEKVIPNGPLGNIGDTPVDWKPFTETHTTTSTSWWGPTTIGSKPKQKPIERFQGMMSNSNIGSTMKLSEADYELLVRCVLPQFIRAVIQNNSRDPTDHSHQHKYNATLPEEFGLLSNLSYTLRTVSHEPMTSVSFHKWEISFPSSYAQFSHRFDILNDRGYIGVHLFYDSFLANNSWVFSFLLDKTASQGGCSILSVEETLQVLKSDCNQVPINNNNNKKKSRLKEDLVLYIPFGFFDYLLSFIFLAFVFVLFNSLLSSSSGAKVELLLRDMQGQAAIIHI